MEGCGAGVKQTDQPEGACGLPGRKDSGLDQAEIETNWEVSGCGVPDGVDFRSEGERDDQGLATY